MPNDKCVAQGNKKRKAEHTKPRDNDGDIICSVVTTPVHRRKRQKTGNGGERRALSIWNFLSYKFSKNYSMKVNKKRIVYPCKDKTIGQLMWEFATEGDLTGALGKPGVSAKAGGMVRCDPQTTHRCLVDFRNTKDYPRQALHSHLRQALDGEGIHPEDKWTFFGGEIKVNVSHIALFVAGHKPPSEDCEASHRCHDTLSCVLADADENTTHLLWENAEMNHGRKNCGQVVQCDGDGCGRLIHVCLVGKIHRPPCLPYHHCDNRMVQPAPPDTSSIQPM